MPKFRLPKCQCSCSKDNLKEQLLLILTIVSVVLAIGIGIALREIKCETDERINGCRITPEDITYIDFPGQLFINVLKMLILPLIVSSIISALAQLDAQTAGKIGVRAIVYYFATTIIAAIIGIILVLTIRPGSRGAAPTIDSKAKAAEGRIADTILDLFRNLFPDNIVEATFRSSATDTKVNETIDSANVTRKVYSVQPTKKDNINVLGLLIFCIFFGIIISRLKEKADVLKRFFEALLEVVMQLIRLAMLYSPIGIFFLIVAKLLEMPDLAAFAGSLGLYMATVLTGLVVHGFIVLPLIMLIITRRNIFRYTLNMSQALLTAFGTGSSSATLPVTYRCVEEKNHIDQRVSRFVLPIGATVNMDGTALYEAVAAIYIAQLNNVPLNAAKVIITSLTATLASVGAASIPQAGLVTMVIVLNALGLPSDDVKLIFAVDWLLDRFRTAINVFGDAVGCGVVQHLSRKELEALNNDDKLEESTAVITALVDPKNDDNTPPPDDTVTETQRSTPGSGHYKHHETSVPDDTVTGTRTSTPGSGHYKHHETSVPDDTVTETRTSTPRSGRYKHHETSVPDDTVTETRTSTPRSGRYKHHETSVPDNTVTEIRTSKPRRHYKQPKTHDNPAFDES